MLSSEQIAELRAAHEAATKDWDLRPGFIESMETGDDIFEVCSKTGDEDLSVAVLARNTLPELLDEVERLRGRLYDEHSEKVGGGTRGILNNCWCSDCAAHRAAKEAE